MSTFGALPSLLENSHGVAEQGHMLRDGTVPLEPSQPQRGSYPQDYPWEGKGMAWWLSM